MFNVIAFFVIHLDSPINSSEDIGFDIDVIKY